MLRPTVDRYNGIWYSMYSLLIWLKPSSANSSLIKAK